MGMATHDVANFVRKQTIHKRTKMCPDLKVQKVAMQSKLVDAVAYSKRLRRQRDALKGKLYRQYSSNKARVRRKLEALAKQYNELKCQEIEDAKAKIDHYVMRNNLEKAKKCAPFGTESLLSDVNVFSEIQSEIEPAPPEEPFICHKDINLTENEIKILSRGPNFMVRDELDREMFCVNLEKMVTKKKFNSAFEEKEDNCLENGATAPRASDQSADPEIVVSAEEITLKTRLPSVLLCSQLLHWELCASPA